jgi:hypothetical protein
MSHPIIVQRATHQYAPDDPAATPDGVALDSLWFHAEAERSAAATSGATVSDVLLGALLRGLAERRRGERGRRQATLGVVEQLRSELHGHLRMLGETLRLGAEDLAGVAEDLADFYDPPPPPPPRGRLPLLEEPRVRLEEYAGGDVRRFGAYLQGAVRLTEVLHLSGVSAEKLERATMQLWKALAEAEETLADILRQSRESSAVAG